MAVLVGLSVLQLGVKENVGLKMLCRKRISVCSALESFTLARPIFLIHPI